MLDRKAIQFKKKKWVMKFALQRKNDLELEQQNSSKLKDSVH